MLDIKLYFQDPTLKIKMTERWHNIFHIVTRFCKCHFLVIHKACDNMLIGSYLIRYTNCKQI